MAHNTRNSYSQSCSTPPEETPPSSLASDTFSFKSNSSTVEVVLRFSLLVLGLERLCFDTGYMWSCMPCETVTKAHCSVSSKVSDLTHCHLYFRHLVKEASLHIWGHYYHSFFLSRPWVLEFLILLFLKNL